MKKLTILELHNLPFGSIVKVVWVNDYEYRGVIFGDNIGYEDGKIDHFCLIGNYMISGICEVYLEDKQNDKEE